jgi:hypothetical protein
MSIQQKEVMEEMTIIPPGYKLLLIEHNKFVYFFKNFNYFYIIFMKGDKHLKVKTKYNEALVNFSLIP